MAVCRSGQARPSLASQDCPDGQTGTGRPSKTCSFFDTRTREGRNKSHTPPKKLDATNNQTPLAALLSHSLYLFNTLRPVHRDRERSQRSHEGRKAGRQSINRSMTAFPSLSSIKTTPALSLFHSTPAHTTATLRRRANSSPLLSSPLLTSPHSTAAEADLAPAPHTLKSNQIKSNLLTLSLSGSAELTAPSLPLALSCLAGRGDGYGMQRERERETQTQRNAHKHTTTTHQKKYSDEEKQKQKKILTQPSPYLKQDPVYCSIQIAVYCFF